MINLETLEKWLVTPTETEQLEFKEAKQQYDSTKLREYCIALANEGGGYLVLGVTDKRPRQVVGSQAWSTVESLNKLKAGIFQDLRFRVDITELQHPNGRVLVFKVPPRPTGQALEYKGIHWMRVGEELRPMTVDRLKQIFAEDQQDWFFQPARLDASPDDVIALLDTQTYFELLKVPYPTTREAVLERLQSQDLIKQTTQGWTITNLAAIVLAKKLDAFSLALARKAPRVVLYEGSNKLQTRDDKMGNRGYAVSFEKLVSFVHSAAPQNRFIEEAVRQEVKMFPIQALRELIANALVHQDFLATGASVMIEMYSDRIEISNPGIPPIPVDRFIDEYRSRNEQLADLMRRFGICEEKGSGIDKVVSAAEVYQLPAPDFRVGETRTTTVLFAYQTFDDMSKSDRIRACYQHCCLLYVSNRQMSNQTLRERFGFDESKNVLVSQVISATKESGLIKPDYSASNSTRYARYLPFWA
ncbi:MAG: putative DNA binding domain-containing protein [Pseudanabaena sp. M135S2SP2A07QC]|jgi:ATP-dependent DNA helicase RecG|nr:putative DNA binding domain-containing protein [Pseudanabaena sp. M179S2SP2A07QC]MCA6528792.1 putative DNA binding domain-containing protein [Pseudanabaena sp. M125S2SP2A07QC]MCA6536754.1 putative DNA binding domain-containing protein [Pseudanabaena sp. M176S2SP2A07QC]MCA6539352.1 putative DNA binding domain-containing protein [Pseudanabaena sp. M037S2SP2A07QC]MCA6543532.1 putative DNA binding domain-containing protein [Pseudanabaena sp. M074S1SP2A07QC]MCA6549233.1 putative DNA binding doma